MRRQRNSTKKISQAEEREILPRYTKLRTILSMPKVAKTIKRILLASSSIATLKQLQKPLQIITKVIRTISSIKFKRESRNSCNKSDNRSRQRDCSNKKTSKRLKNKCYLEIKLSESSNKFSEKASKTKSSKKGNIVSHIEL